MGKRINKKPSNKLFEFLLNLGRIRLIIAKSNEYPFDFVNRWFNVRLVWVRVSLKEVVILGECFCKSFKALISL